MSEPVVYTSNSKYIFTTRYTDYELLTNKHPEATVNIPGKPGYAINILELTVNICAEKAGKTAFCTYLFKTNNKLVNPGKEIKSTANKYNPVKMIINKQFGVGAGVVFYLHLKTSDSNSKAMVKNFQVKYEYIVIAQENDGEDSSDKNPDGTIDYIIQISGTQENVQAAYETISKMIGDTATVTKYTPE